MSGNSREEDEEDDSQWKHEGMKDLDFASEDVKKEIGG